MKLQQMQIQQMQMFVHRHQLLENRRFEKPSLKIEEEEEQQEQQVWVEWSLEMNKRIMVMVDLKKQKMEKQKQDQKEKALMKCSKRHYQEWKLPSLAQHLLYENLKDHNEEELSNPTKMLLLSVMHHFLILLLHL
jgi:hypothetical protein